jgi:hypothetical protein
MNYQIIKDEKKLKDFIEWLPDLLPHETYYCALFARSKYCKNITKLTADKQQLKRFTTNKAYMYDKLKQLECEIGSYTQKHIPIPQEAISVYISPNPRDMEVAAKKGLIELAKLITNPYNGYNPHVEMLNCIQTSCSRKIYYDIDFDNVKIEDMQDKINEILNPDCLTYLQTYGGFHLLININKIENQFVKSWHQKISSLIGVDVRGDNLIPIPGTHQGGFIPSFYVKDVKNKNSFIL